MMRLPLAPVLCLALLGALPSAGRADARPVVLPEPQSGLLVLPKGQERQTSRICGRQGGTVDQRTVLGLAWDDQGLLATVDCADASVVAAPAGGDARLEDAVELLLDPGHRHGVPLIVRVSASGAVSGFRGAAPGFEVPGLFAKAVRTRDGWRATLLLPWAGLGMPAPRDGEVWGFNLKRVDAKEPASLETTQVGSWLPFATDSQDVMAIGQIAFVLPATLEDDAKLAAMRDTVAAGHAAAVRAWAGPNEADLLALGDKPVEVPRLGLVASGAPARQATRVTVARDADGLDVVFDCDDRDILAAQEGRDNVKLWKDDSVYVWLNPGHDHATTVLVQVSAAGLVHDMKNGDIAWNLAGLVADATRTGKGWRAHINIPWQGLGVPAPKVGDAWGFNLARMDQPGKADFALMELSSLAIIPGGDLGAVHRWGHLAFGTADQAAPAVKAAHAARWAEVDARLAAVAAERKAVQERNAARRGIPANPNASAAARKVLRILADLPQRQDKRLILCQESWSYDGGNAGGYQQYVEKLAETSGKRIGMLHVSYGNATPSTSTQPGYQDYLADANRLAIRHWQAGGLVTIHINPENPITCKTVGDSLKERERIAEVATPGTEAHKNWRRKLDEYATLLAVLRDAGVVVLWRPLHEMTFTNCYWYDAGATKDREVYKAIWRDMFRYFSEEKKLDHLLWVYSATTLNGRAAGSMAADEMYPGPEYVDVVGLSQYSDDVDITGNVYETLTALGKPFAMSEFGPGHSATAPNGVALMTAGGLDNLDLLRAVREKYPLTTYATYWGSWPGANMAIIHVPHAVELVRHPWIANCGDPGLTPAPGR